MVIPKWVVFAVVLWLAIPLGFGMGEDPQAGVVVERVGKNSALERAGVQAGDLLLSWDRDGAKGTFDTVFVWHAFLVEETPRGTIKLHGTRGGEPIVFEVLMGNWSGTDIRPVMNTKELRLYFEGKDFIDSGNISLGVDLWKKLLIGNSARREFSCWILHQQFLALEDKPLIKKGTKKLEKALTITNDPWSQIVLWGTIGSAQQTRNDLEGALISYQQQAEIWRRNRGEGLGFANSLEQIGKLLLSQGNLERSTDYFHCVLTIRHEFSLGSLAFGLSLKNMGDLAWERRKLNEANSYFNRALKIVEHLDPGSPNHASIVNKFGKYILCEGFSEESY